MIVAVQAEDGEKRLDFPLERRFVDAAKTARQTQIFGCGEVRIDMRLLGHVSHLRLVRDEVVLHVLPIEQDLSARGRHQADDHLHRR